MFNHILVAVDGSEWSQRALDKAITYIQENEEKTSLTIVHTIRSKQGKPPMGVGEFPAALYDYESKLAELSKENGEQILNAAKSVIQEAGVEAQFELLQGDPAKSINEYAQKNNIDLILIGSRGLSGLKELMLGSVSNKVAQLSTVPVLIIK